MIWNKKTLSNALIDSDIEIWRYVKVLMSLHLMDFLCALQFCTKLLVKTISYSSEISYPYSNLLFPSFNSLSLVRAATDSGSPVRKL